MGMAMFGLDDWIAELAHGEGLALVLLVSLLLGLRHASDPDHLAAVSTLIASDPEDGTRRAGRLGLAWGGGHALTLAAFGLPIVLLQAYLPDMAQRAAEAAVGLMIMFLAARLLLRWRRGHFHAHAHRHGDVEHRHLHPHQPHSHDATQAHSHGAVHGHSHGADHGHSHGADHGHSHGADHGHSHGADHGHSHGAVHDHTHEPEARLGRSPWQAFGIGLMHGAGGSAGVGVLVLATIPGQAEAVAALMVLAAGTAVSMASLSSAFGYAITRGPVLRRMLAFAPAMGLVTLAFGGWYTLGAIGAVPYL
jgi:ABC-type nickel/cobalt efflux system permease component RcnA